MNECASCSRTGDSGSMKCYTVRKGGETHRVCFCNECHAAFEKAAQGSRQDGKARRAVKGVVKGLEAIGLIIMMVIFALTLVTLKLIMTTKSGDGGDDGDEGDTGFGDGGNPGFGSGDSSIFGGGDGSDGGDTGFGSEVSSFSEAGDESDGGESMLDDFKSEDLMGYEVSDETGNVYSTDGLVRRLYGSKGTFSEDETTFIDKNQTFSEDET